VRVGIIQDRQMEYPREAPFHPGEIYPEIARLPWARAAESPNRVYAGVRRGFQLLGLDAGREGTPEWNPLAAIVRPGERVLIKPNLVLHEPARLKGSGALFTHASVIRPVVDYVLLATGGDCTITIGDCPLQEANLAQVLEANGLEALLAFYRMVAGVPLSFVDFRLDRMDLRPDGRVASRGSAPGDPAGNVTVHVDGLSALDPITRGGDRFSEGYQQAFAVALYDQRRTAVRHAPGRHEYVLPRTALEADIVINIPKLKTHQKAGLTVCMKNLVGINADKSCLPHYREGAPEDGGDEYPRKNWLSAWNRRARRRLAESNRVVWFAVSRTWRFLKTTLLTRAVLGAGSPVVQNLDIAAGAWDGNDTLWRTILDLNTILYFADRAGRIGGAPCRRSFFVVDGVVSGEGNGPLLPVPRKDGVILVGADPLAVDVVAARLMGLDWTRVPQLREAARREHHRFSEFLGDPATIETVSDDPRWRALFRSPEHLGYEPPPGWYGVRLPAAAATGSR